MNLIIKRNKLIETKLSSQERLVITKLGGKGVVTDFERYEADLNAKCVCGCMDGNRFHKTYRFPNDYGASVVSNPKLAGRNPGGFMVLPIKFITPQPENEYVIEMDQPIEGLAVECQDWAEVESSLTKILNH